MSQENVEVILRMLAAWSRGERDAAREAYDPDVVLVAPFDAQETRGIPALERSLESWRGTFDDWHFEIAEAIDAGDRVIVVTRQRGTGRESGVPTQLVNASVFSLRNSKIARVEIVSSREEALALAGLAEPG